MSRFPRSSISAVGAIPSSTIRAVLPIDRHEVPRERRGSGGVRLATIQSRLFLRAAGAPVLFSVSIKLTLPTR